MMIGSLLPPDPIAVILNVYFVYGFKSFTSKLVFSVEDFPTLVVLATSLTSISYLQISPFLFFGSAQLRFICQADFTVAVTFRGGLGASNDQQENHEMNSPASED